MSERSTDLVPASPIFDREYTQLGEEESGLREARGESVEEFLRILREVSYTSPSTVFTLLPARPVDTFEMAQILTQPHYVGSHTFRDINKVNFYQGQYGEADLEYAVEHIAQEVDGSGLPNIVWGMRRIKPRAKDRLSSKLLVTLPSELFKIEEIELTNINDLDVFGMRQAA